MRPCSGRKNLVGNSKFQLYGFRDSVPGYQMDGYIRASGFIMYPYVFVTRYFPGILALAELQQISWHIPETVVCYDLILNVGRPSVVQGSVVQGRMGQTQTTNLDQTFWGKDRVRRNHISCSAS